MDIRYLWLLNITLRIFSRGHFTRVTMAKCAVLLRTYEKSFKILPMRSALNTNISRLDGLIFLEEEIIMYNVYQFCVISIDSEAGNVRRLDICRLMIQTSQKLATTAEGRVYYNLLKKMMFDTWPSKAARKVNTGDENVEQWIHFSSQYFLCNFLIKLFQTQ